MHRLAPLLRYATGPLAAPKAERNGHEQHRCAVEQQVGGVAGDEEAEDDRALRVDAAHVARPRNGRNLGIHRAPQRGVEAGVWRKLRKVAGTHDGQILYRT